MLTRGTLIYIAQRLVLIAFTVLVVSFMVFAMVHTLPGNAFISEKLRGQALLDVLRAYGLDQPIPIQYWNWLKGAIHGDFGISFVLRDAPITPIVLREFSVSAM